jgi:hypothetical protein
MAFFAGHIRMCAFQFKSCFIMIKAGWVPVIKSVALFAVGFSVFLELSVMLIGVAIGAALCQAFELLMDISLINFPEMAIATA